MANGAMPASSYSIYLKWVYPNNYGYNLEKKKTYFTEQVV